jgi:glutathione-independent formaldehyde dehydrogenase
MKAVVYQAPYQVAVEEYEGRADVEQGKILGHENMGIVQETGPGVTQMRPGDRVPVPFNVSCGTCRNCTSGWTTKVVLHPAA